VISLVALALRTKRFVLPATGVHRRSVLIDMAGEHGAVNRRKSAWWVTMFRDVHFWVPVAVLLAGLILLRAIQ
jgi:hypothetical protein